MQNIKDLIASIAGHTSITQQFNALTSAVSALTDKVGELQARVVELEKGNFVGIAETAPLEQVPEVVTEPTA